MTHYTTDIRRGARIRACILLLTTEYISAGRPGHPLGVGGARASLVFSRVLSGDILAGGVGRVVS